MRRMGEADVRFYRRVAWVAVCTALVGGLGYGGWLLWLRWTTNARAMALLESVEAESRKRGAWEALSNRSKPALWLIRERLEAGAERDADVRETYYYFLGRMGYGEDWGLIERCIHKDESGYVRQQAWLSALRIDAERCRKLSEEFEAKDRWDRIGVAQARLGLDDASGVADLLEAIEHGDEGEREIAAKVIGRFVRPLLDAEGKWPIEVPWNPEQPWTLEEAQKVRERCDRIDAVRSMSELAELRAKSQELRKLQGRLMGGMRRMAGFMLEAEAARGHE